MPQLEILDLTVSQLYLLWGFNLHGPMSFIFYFPSQQAQIEDFVT